MFTCCLWTRANDSTSCGLALLFLHSPDAAVVCDFILRRVEERTQTNRRRLYPITELIYSWVIKGCFLLFRSLCNFRLAKVVHEREKRDWVGPDHVKSFWGVGGSLLWFIHPAVLTFRARNGQQTSGTEAKESICDEGYGGKTLPLHLK